MSAKITMAVVLNEEPWQQGFPEVGWYVIVKLPWKAEQEVYGPFASYGGAMIEAEAIKKRKLAEQEGVVA